MIRSLRQLELKQAEPKKVYKHKIRNMHLINKMNDIGINKYNKMCVLDYILETMRNTNHPFEQKLVDENGIEYIYRTTPFLFKLLGVSGVSISDIKEVIKIIKEHEIIKFRIEKHGSTNKRYIPVGKSAYQEAVDRLLNCTNKPVHRLKKSPVHRLKNEPEVNHIYKVVEDIYSNKQHNIDINNVENKESRVVIDNIESNSSLNDIQDIEPVSKIEHQTESNDSHLSVGKESVTNQDMIEELKPINNDILEPQIKQNDIDDRNISIDTKNDCDKDQCICEADCGDAEVMSEEEYEKLMKEVEIELEINEEVYNNATFEEQKAMAEQLGKRLDERIHVVNKHCENDPMILSPVLEYNKVLSPIQKSQKHNITNITDIATIRKIESEIRTNNDGCLNNENGFIMKNKEKKHTNIANIAVKMVKRVKKEENVYDCMIRKDKKVIREVEIKEKHTILLNKEAVLGYFRQNIDRYADKMQDIIDNLNERNKYKLQQIEKLIRCFVNIGFSRKEIEEFIHKHSRNSTDKVASTNIERYVYGRSNKICDYSRESICLLYKIIDYVKSYRRLKRIDNLKGYIITLMSDKNSFCKSFLSNKAEYKMIHDKLFLNDSETDIYSFRYVNRFVLEKIKKTFNVRLERDCLLSKLNTDNEIENHIYQYFTTDMLINEIDGVEEFVNNYETMMRVVSSRIGFCSNDNTI